MTKIVVFTDLDATLLDHHTYDWTPARPALDRLKSTGTPLIMVSSKNRFEIQALRAELDNNHPFIPENGGAVFIPPDYPLDPPDNAVNIDGYRTILLGRTKTEITAAFDQLGTLVPVRAISRMSVPEVAEITGLSLAKAEVARSREFGEAFVLAGEGVAEEELARLVASLGLRLTKGARFFHLLGENDKGRAVSILADLYRRRSPEIMTAALGDSYNDIPMLAAVDRPFLVARPEGGHSGIDLPGLTKVSLPGPAGFNQTVMQLLDRLGL